MVGLHATADPNGQPWPEYDVADRVVPAIIRTTLYIARTELFIIISLFLLLLALDRRPRNYQTTMLEQSRRLLVPFVFWTVFYAFYGLIKADAFGYFDAAWGQITTPINWIGFFLLGDVKYHMHFIPTLFGVVLMYPLFRLAQQYPVLGLGIVVCLVVKRELDAFVFSEFWGTEVLSYLVRGTKIVTYAGYGLAAGAAYGIWSRTKGQGISVFLPIILYLGGVLILFKGIAAARMVESGRFVFDYEPGYWADFLMPMLLFALCMALSAKRWPSILSRVAPFAFGIYLCHPIFLDLAEIWMRSTALAPTAQILTKITLVLPATCALVVLISKSSALAWTIGLGPLPWVPFLGSRNVRPN